MRAFRRVAPDNADAGRLHLPKRPTHMTVSGTAQRGAGGSRSLVIAFGLTGGAILLAVLIVLVITLGQIKSTEDHVAATDARLERVIAAAAPVADEAEPLIDAADKTLDESLPAVRDASDLFATLSDNGSDVSVVLDRLPALQLGVMSFFGDAALTVRLASDFLAAAQSQDLVGKAVDSHRLLENVLAVQLETLDIQEASLRTQRRSLSVQLSSNHKLRRSLGIQRSTLDHVRSLDNKTGGELPTP